MDEVNDRFTLPAHHQDTQKVNDIIGDQVRGDFVNAGEGTHISVGLSNNQRPGHQISSEISPPVEQGAVLPGGSSEEIPGSRSNDQVQRDDSFYWHSPQTSASTSHDRDYNRDVPGTSSLLDATPESQEQQISSQTEDVNPKSTPERTASLFQSTVAPYSASALGFGGPSDWEHFGDYDGEEVDDTDLYLRPRSPIRQTVPIDTPELPADSAPAIVQTAQSRSVHEESSQTASSAQPEVLMKSGQRGEPQANQAQYRDGDAQSLDETINDTRKTSALEQAFPDHADLGHGPYFKDQKASPIHDSAPKLPMLDFEQVQQNPELTPHSTKKLSMVEAAETSALHDDELPGPPANGSPVRSATVDDKVPEPNVAPLPKVQNRLDISKPPTEVTNAETEYLDHPSQEDSEPTSDIHDISREASVKRASLVSDGSALSKLREPNDPYVDLDPWAKASLNRYIVMLHEEAQAPTDLEKLNMFKAFSRKEWRLRAVLYGADDEQGNDLFSRSKTGPIERVNTLEFRRPASKALPALPIDADGSKSESSQETSVASPRAQAPALGKLVTMTEEDTPTRSSGEESYIVVDTPSGHRQQSSEEEINESYSPGGRPIQAQVREARRAVAQSPPNANDQNDSRYSVASNDSKPAYTPFRYSQGYVDDADQPVDRRASFRPYAALKLEPVQDHAETAPEPVLEASRPISLPQNVDDRYSEDPASAKEQFSGQRLVPAATETQQSSPADLGKSLDLRRFERADFDPLITVLPSLGSIPHSAVELSKFQSGMNAVPDEFGFIHQHVVAWDTKAKELRTAHEKERRMRQTESEQRIDALFNDDEIGYGDIGELEEEFKKAEAARKTSEDRAEYSTFVEEVFNAVWARLHFEIDQLTPLYNEYTGLAHETVAGKDMFEAVQGQYALAPTMSALLTLHQKLEIRHQKAFEAVLERDRRLKKTEVAPWYTLGNVAKVKQLEKQFDRAEKKAIGEYCKQRDARANRLMDVLDQNTHRG